MDEWLSLDKFKLSEEDKQILPLPIKNSDDLLSTSQVANWILKATSDTQYSEASCGTILIFFVQGPATKLMI